MSDQAPEQSPQELSIEDRMAAIVADEVPEEEIPEEQPAPQDNGEEAEESEEVDTPEEEQVETEEESEEPDLVEIEVEGESYRVPEALKDKIMLQADYTRKTQEVAEQRKQIEKAQADLNLQAQIQQESIGEYAHLVALDNQLKSLDSIDWNQKYDEDPAEFVRLKELRRDLLDQRQNITNQLGQKGEQILAHRHQNNMQILEQAQAKVPEVIKGWNPTLAKDLGEYAVKSGLPAQIVYPQYNERGYMLSPGLVDPLQLSLLHKAYLYDKQQSGKPLTEKKVANLPKVSKPGGPSNKTVNQNRVDEARKNLKKSGSVDAAQEYFRAKYS